jgi:opacity protein-like surface antigen
MKKGLFLLVFTLFGFLNINAQTSVGGGLSLWDNTGLELKADFGINDQISISPSIDYFFSDLKNATFLMVNVDGHYNLGDPDALNYYPLAGLNYYYFSWETPKSSFGGETVGGSKVSDGQIGISIGGGVTYPISDAIKLFGELKFMSNKYMVNDLGASFGILFSL